MADKFPTPTIFLTSEEDTKMYEICTELKISRTHFIYQAILAKIEENDRNNNNNPDDGGKATHSQ